MGTGNAVELILFGNVTESTDILMIGNSAEFFAHKEKLDIAVGISFFEFEEIVDEHRAVLFLVNASGISDIA
jgi:hypothetical protein